MTLQLKKPVTTVAKTPENQVQYHITEIGYPHTRVPLETQVSQVATV